MATPAPIDFVTMGMFIIDQIHFPQPDAASSVKVVDDIIGGAGTFGILGARLFSPSPLSRRMGWIVDAGYDFPDSIRSELKRWDTTLVLRETPERKTTRGWNWYGEGDFRDFKYLTPKLRLEASDLISTPLIDSASYHLISNPTRAASTISDLLSLRTIKAPPIIIWEPVPDLCTPEQLPLCMNTLPLVDIVSPNAAEIGAFYDVHEPEASKIEIVERHALLWRDKVKRAVVVRAGKDGCCVVDKDHVLWLPAYYNKNIEGVDVKKVADPTGGGNAFIGGLAVGLARKHSIVVAACFATVAASLVIEQVGMPTLSFKDDGTELWNDVAVLDRLDSYLMRVRNLKIDVDII